MRTAVGMDRCCCCCCDSVRASTCAATSSHNESGSGRIVCSLSFFFLFFFLSFRILSPFSDCNRPTFAKGKRYAITDGAAGKQTSQFDSVAGDRNVNSWSRILTRIGRMMGCSRLYVGREQAAEASVSVSASVSVGVGIGPCFCPVLFFFPSGTSTCGTHQTDRCAPGPCMLQSVFAAPF